MRITKVPARGFSANCWLLCDEVSGTAAVIDPDAKADAILSALTEQNATLSMILLTHGHFDHISAADALRDATGAPLLIHEKDASMLTDAVANASSIFFSEGQTYRAADRFLKGGDALRLGENTIAVRHMPGHSPGSVCFVVGRDLFTGDTLFKDSIGRTDLPGGSEKQLSESLRRLRFMPGDYTVYPGHGEITTLERERLYNPYFQDGQGDTK